MRVFCCWQLLLVDAYCTYIRSQLCSLFPWPWMSQQTQSKWLNRMRPLLTHQQAMPCHMSQILRSLAPLMSLCHQATILRFHKRRMRDSPKSCHSKKQLLTTFPTGPNVDASTRATTSIWSVLHQGVTHWVRAQTLQCFLNWTRNPPSPFLCMTFPSLSLFLLFFLSQDI